MLRGSSLLLVAEPEPLIKLSEAARRLAVSESTIRRMVKRGDVPVIQVGEQLRVDPAVLRDLVQAWARAQNSPKSHPAG